MCRSVDGTQRKKAPKAYIVATNCRSKHNTPPALFRAFSPQQQRWCFCLPQSDIFMNTTIIFYQEAINAVSEVTSLAKENILHSRTEQATNARYLLIQILSARLTDEAISSLLGITRQAANKARNHFAERCRGSWELRQSYNLLSSYFPP